MYSYIAKIMPITIKGSCFFTVKGNRLMLYKIKKITMLSYFRQTEHTYGAAFFVYFIEFRFENQKFIY